MNYIDIYDDKNQKHKMKIINTIFMDNKRYIIYSELDESHYYVARYNEEGTLETDLSEQEIKRCEAILEEIK